MVIPSETAVPVSRRSLPRKRKVLIVDDHPLFRLGLVELLARQEDMEVCGEAANSAAALEVMRASDPDLVIVDVSLPGANGIDLTKRIKAEKPGLPVLIVSIHDGTLYPLRALRAGASGYVIKRAAVSEVVGAVRHVLTGQIYLAAELAERLILKSIGHDGAHANSPVDPLSDRELEVMELVGRGFSTRDIAGRLNLSVKTVESHRAHIKEKLGCKDGAEMVRFAMDWTSHQNL